MREEIHDSLTDMCGWGFMHIEFMNNANGTTRTPFELNKKKTLAKVSFSFLYIPFYFVSELVGDRGSDELQGAMKVGIMPYHATLVYSGFAFLSLLNDH